VSTNPKAHRSYLHKIKLPVLFSSALTILILCLILYKWLDTYQKHQEHLFSTTYNQGLADTSAAFLGQLIEDEDTEAIEVAGQQLSAHKNIQQLSIFRRNGELVYQQGDKSTPHNPPVISNIAYQGNYNGYLIIYFVPTSELIDSTSPFFFNHTMVWVFGALIWFVIFLILYSNRWFKKSNKAQPSIQKQEQSTKNNTQLLKELIRRNKQNKSAIIDSSVIIKANWGRLSEESNNQLLRILSRWLPQNELFATQFNDGLLVLGVTLEHSPIKRNSLYSLYYGLHRLQLEPKIIVHRLDFGQDIYQTFFDIIETGIWFEKRLIETGSHYQWPSQKVIDIELAESDSSNAKGTVIELCQLEEPDAEQRGLIERQVRFLMND